MSSNLIRASNFLNMDCNKDILYQLLIIENKSYKEVGKLYQITGAAIKKRALKLGIELPVRRKTNKKESFNLGTVRTDTKKCLYCNREYIKYKNKSKNFCSLECKKEYYRDLLYLKIINGDKSIMRANYNPRIFKDRILKEQNGVCAICKIPPIWNNNILVFILDHIDGNAANNRRDNLRCICPNCDSQLDTYKSKNKNGARSYYRYNKENGGIIGNSQE